MLIKCRKHRLSVHTFGSVHLVRVAIPGLMNVSNRNLLEVFRDACSGSIRARSHRDVLYTVVTTGIRIALHHFRSVGLVEAGSSVGNNRNMYAFRVCLFGSVLGLGWPIRK